MIFNVWLAAGVTPSIIFTILALLLDDAFAIDTVFAPLPAEIATIFVPEDDPKVIVPVCVAAPKFNVELFAPDTVKLPVPKFNVNAAAPVVDPIVIRLAPAPAAILTVLPPVPPAIVTVETPLPPATITAFVADDDPKVIVPVCAVLPIVMVVLTAPSIKIFPVPACRVKLAAPVVDPIVTKLAANHWQFQLYCLPRLKKSFRFPLQL